MKSTYLYIVLVVALIAGLVFLRNINGPKEVTATATSVYDSFAQCISDSGAKFYGAYWCPHCQAQKKLFNESKKLPYIECSTTSGQGQTKVCADAGIKSYPTWILKDGTHLDGEQTFDELSAKTNCTAPKIQ